MMLAAAAAKKRVFRFDVILTSFSFFFQAEDGIRAYKVTGVQTCALPILVLHGNEWYGDAGHAPDVRRPDTSSNNHNPGANATLRGLNRLHTSIYNLNSGNACIWIESSPALPCAVCHSLCQHGCFRGAIRRKIEDTFDPLQAHHRKHVP